jgi:1,4-dihydroxy-6-naphthoate synthase
MQETAFKTSPIMMLHIGLSPCPNDTFIFDALLHDKVDTEGLQFTYHLEDVETLNQMARTGQLDVTKVSYGAVSELLPLYRVLDAGGALGNGVGPLLVAKRLLTEEQLIASPIALPGKYTTAHLLFSMAYPEAANKVFMPFHTIEDAVINGIVEAGVIIHENRFTYAEKGLIAIADLGTLWEIQTGAPIPLGGILARRSYDLALLRKINRVIKRSVEYAFQHREHLPDFVIQNAQEMSHEVMNKHIDLYVNNYSLELGTTGRAAVWQLLESTLGLLREPVGSHYEVFVD